MQYKLNGNITKKSDSIYTDSTISPKAFLYLQRQPGIQTHILYNLTAKRNWRSNSLVSSCLAGGICHEFDFAGHGWV